MVAGSLLSLMNDTLLLCQVLSWKGEASDAKLQRLELLLHGPFADVSLVPSTGGTQMAALLVLTSPGQLYVYDEAGMASCFSMQNGGATLSSLQPVSWPPVPDATAAKLVPLPNDAAAASILFQVLLYRKQHRQRSQW